VPESPTFIIKPSAILFLIAGTHYLDLQAYALTTSFIADDRIFLLLFRAMT